MDTHGVPGFGMLVKKQLGGQHRIVMGGGTLGIDGHIDQIIAAIRILLLIDLLKFKGRHPNRGGALFCGLLPSAAHRDSLAPRAACL